MDLHSIPTGSILESSYLALPTWYSIGLTCPNDNGGWATAIAAAEGRRTDVLTREGPWTAEETTRAADNVSMIDLRWVLLTSDGTRLDMVAHRYTWAELAGRRAVADAGQQAAAGLTPRNG